MIELNANGSLLAPQMAKQIRWTMHRKEIEPDQARANHEARLQVINSFELCDGMVGDTTADDVPRHIPEKFAGVDFFVDELVPQGEIWFLKDGELVGKITGLAALKV